jgi:predicted membrane channel-forming protein YqfA (hemolysin III family)
VHPQYSVAALPLPPVSTVRPPRRSAATAPISALPERPQSLGEEIANSVSHGLGLLVAIGAFPVLLMAAYRRGDPAGIAAASVFATTMAWHLFVVAGTACHCIAVLRYAA